MIYFEMFYSIMGYDGLIEFIQFYLDTETVLAEFVDDISVLSMVINFFFKNLQIFMQNNFFI